MLRNRFMSIASAMVLGFGVSAQGAGISVNFASEFGALPAPGGDGVAGVVPLGNYNNVPTTGAVALPLVDSANAATTADLTIQPLLGFSASPNFPDADDDVMMDGHSYTNVQFDVGITDVPYATYDLYVYYNSGGVTNNKQLFTVVEAAVSQQGTENNTADDTAYVLSTGSNEANYVLFSNLSLEDFTLRLTPVAGTQGFTYINGLQIVAVPEPTSLALVGLGLGALAARRRRIA